MSSSSSTASSNNSMKGRVPSEEDLITNAGIADMSAAEIDANMDPPTGRPTGGTAMQISTSPGTSPILVSEQLSSNIHAQARDRKRRLTSHNDAARLQRIRSGGTIRQEVHVQAALPHRSVSMAVPSSRSTGSQAPGSSYATAIDITSSPPDAGYPLVDRANIGHGAAAGNPVFRGSSNRARVDDAQDTSTMITSRGQHDPRLDISSHMLSSGAASTSRTSDGSNDRPGYQTWHPALGSGAEADDLTNPRKSKSHGPLPWDPPPRRSSQGSSGHGWGSRMDENSHQGISGQNTGSRYLNRGPDMSRSSVSSTSGTEGDMGRPYLRGDTSNFPRFTDHGDENTLESWRRRPQRMVIDRRRTFSATSDEASRTRNPDTSEYGRYPEYQDYEMPRWQPDAEVTSCPICGTVFTFWYRKHHCRKCGRVVCASCSPHSIVIPRQFIVRPPDSSTSLPSSPPSSLAPVVDLTGDEPDPFNSSLNPALGGGEKVRLCNPCVPDPNPNPLGYGTPRAHGHRSTHSLTSTMGNKNSRVARENPPSRQGRRTVGTNDRPSTLQGLGHPARSSVSGAMDRVRLAGSTSLAGTSAPAPPPQPAPEVSEEDLCPVCGRRFPMLSNEHTQDHREEHVRECIAGYGALPAAAPVPREAQHADLRQPPPPPRPSPAAARMLPFTATEKDCLGEDGSVAECTICMEEYEVGQSLARLNCFCKFHKSCIVDWFERKIECPVHKA